MNFDLQYNQPKVITFSGRCRVTGGEVGRRILTQVAFSADVCYFGIAEVVTLDRFDCILWFPVGPCIYT